MALTNASDYQRSKRLIPRFYKSRKRWAVDLPPDMNAGNRGRKFFSDQASAFAWIAKHTKTHTLQAVKTRVSKDKVSEKVAGLVDTYLATMESRSLSDDGIKQAKTCLLRFSQTFGHLSPKDIDPENIEAWFNSLPYGTRTVWNHYSQTRQFFNWRDVRRLVPISPFQEVEAPDKTNADARKQILSPEQMGDLLKLDVEPWIKCKIVLGGFAGLRTCEMAKMSYECIDHEYKEIMVTKEQSKQGKAMRPRSVTLQDAVLRHMPKGQGSLMGASKEWRCHRGMPMEAKLGSDRFPQNALRHSFASYHLAHFQDAMKTAFEMGHTSPRLIYETYANSVSRRDAANWWNL
jgi:integrase